MSEGTILIGQVAKLTDLSVDSIRFYERQKLVPRPIRTAGRFRTYTAADVARLRFIHEMQGLGFSLNEVKQRLDLRAHVAEACSVVRDLLRANIRNIRAKVSHLRNLEAALVADLRRCNRELRSRKSHRPCICPVFEGQS